MSIAPSDRPRVFVSCPTALTTVQANARREFVHMLGNRRMEVIGINRSSYGAVPWQQLRDAVARADGVVVFGFRQLHVGAGEWRPGTPEERPAAEWYATPWNQIEAGLAIMASVPVLVTGDTGVVDGVFAPEAWGECVFGLPMDSEPGAGNVVFDTWAAAVCAQAASRTG